MSDIILMVGTEGRRSRTLASFDVNHVLTLINQLPINSSYLCNGSAVIGYDQLSATSTCARPSFTQSQVHRGLTILALGNGKTDPPSRTQSSPTINVPLRACVYAHSDNSTWTYYSLVLRYECTYLQINQLKCCNYWCTNVIKSKGITRR